MTRPNSCTRVDFSPFMGPKVPLENLVKKKKKKIQSSFHNKAHTLHTISRFMNPLKPTMGFTSSAVLFPKVSCSLS